jgi:hypothetical protein
VAVTVVAVYGELRVPEGSEVGPIMESAALTAKL